MVDPSRTPDNYPKGSRGASPAAQLAVAMAMAMAFGWLVDWATAAHVLFTVLALFTSVNRVDRRCSRCGR